MKETTRIIIEGIITEMVDTLVIKPEKKQTKKAEDTFTNILDLVKRIALLPSPTIRPN